MSRHISTVASTETQRITATQLPPWNGLHKQLLSGSEPFHLCVSVVDSSIYKRLNVFIISISDVT